MPNPLSRVNPKAEPRFDNNALSRNPCLAAKALTTISLTARLDATVGSIFTRLVWAEGEKGAAIYGALISTNAQNNAMSAVAPLALTEGQLDIFNAVQSISSRARVRRHDLAHGLWGHAESMPDALLLLPANSVVRLLQRVGVFSDRLKSGEQPDPVEIPDKSEVLVYTEADFASMNEDLVAASVAWHNFEVWVWNPFPGAPPTPEEAYRRLLGRKDVLDHVNKARENKKLPPLTLP